MTVINRRLPGRCPRIVVVGSANIDLVARSARLPEPGETVTGSSFMMVPGGKSANQAVAAARLGAETYFVGRVGNDVFGGSLERSFSGAGVNTLFLKRDSAESTGTALISVNETTGENCIIVVPGANGKVSEADVAAAADVISGADAVVLSLEIPLSAVAAALEIASNFGVLTVLNPAPAIFLPDSIIRRCSILTPNEHEVGILAGGSAGTIRESAASLIKRGAGTVVVTLGGDGTYSLDSQGAESSVGSFPVANVVDTTAAGDCYTGALVVALCEGQDHGSAMRFAAAAASICITRPGAQSSLPRRGEVDLLLNDR